MKIFVYVLCTEEKTHSIYKQKGKNASLEITRLCSKTRHFKEKLKQTPISPLQHMTPPPQNQNIKLHTIPLPAEEKKADYTKNRTLGRKKTEGTESMDTIIRTSAEHPNLSEKMSILAKGGSSGNSTILRPRAVNPPVLSSAPRIHSWYKEDWILSCTYMLGGGST